MGFFAKLKEGLKKTKDAFTNGINNIFKSFKKVDEDLFDELEELMITSDCGVEFTEKTLDELRDVIKKKKITETSDAKAALIEILKDSLDVSLDNGIKMEDGKMTVIMMVGVNGVGKTTTIAKLAKLLKDDGKKVLLCAADTFRAAASEQLSIWADRVGCPIVKHGEGADPAAVVFDAISSSKTKGIDVLIIDTAGRLHNKSNLMNELAKIDRVVDKELPDANRETFLVLDATTGHNAVNQAQEFKKYANVTGLVLTKLDGTAKGGVVFSIKDDLNIPVKFIGVGEKMDDLQPFSCDDFIKAMFDEGE